MPSMSGTVLLLEISRTRAKEISAPHFFTGAPCKRGHIYKRRVDNGECVLCARERSLAWEKNNPERRKLISKESWRRNYAIDPEKQKARSRAQYRDLRDADPIGLLLKSVRQRARRGAIEFSLTRESLHVPMCARFLVFRYAMASENQRLIHHRLIGSIQARAIRQAMCGSSAGAQTDLRAMGL